jgi:hypothetical protein
MSSEHSGNIENISMNWGSDAILNLCHAPDYGNAAVDNRSGSYFAPYIEKVSKTGADIEGLKKKSIIYQPIVP